MFFSPALPLQFLAFCSRHHADACGIQVANSDNLEYIRIDTHSPGASVMWSSYQAASGLGAGVLFSLRPLNDRARAVVAHLSNEHLSRVDDDSGSRVLGIGHVRSISDVPTTLATLGRNGDIFIGGSNIAKIQCSFEINPDSNIVMFYDRSFNQTCQVFGPDACPFEHGRPRKVVVTNKFNTIIGIGGVGRDLIQFALMWPRDCLETMKLVKTRRGTPLQVNPRLAHTVTQDEAETAQPSLRGTRVHAAGPRDLKVRWKKIGERLGAGQFGEVYRVIDVDLGRLMAVKTLKPPETGTQKWGKFYEHLKREVENLARISHEHIVDYISSEDWNGPNPRIIMGLKDGDLQGLIKGGGHQVPIRDLATSVFHHMLQALDHLAHSGIIHRDVKPENILFDRRPDNKFTFLLGDFGLSNTTAAAATTVGSPLYMAPELITGRGPQTPKLDVWSLFVTMLWTLDAGGFRQTSEQPRGLLTFGDIQEAVLKAASTPVMSDIREMGMVSPDQRASAAQMLVKLFNGEGLTSPPARVPPLV